MGYFILFQNLVTLIHEDHKRHVLHILADERDGRGASQELEQQQQQLHSGLPDQLVQRGEADPASGKRERDQSAPLLRRLRQASTQTR